VLADYRARIEEPEVTAAVLRAAPQVADAAEVGR
jgi:hypothetical protein